MKWSTYNLISLESFSLIKNWADWRVKLIWNTIIGGLYWKYAFSIFMSGGGGDEVSDCGDVCVGEKYGNQLIKL